MVFSSPRRFCRVTIGPEYVFARKSMSSWGCQHDIDGRCGRVNHLPCDPGMKGCVLFGRFRWADESKNRPPKATRRDRRGPPAQEAGNKSALPEND
jgi:hypothetical protein